MKKNFDPIILVEDDGLFFPEVGIWSLEKYQILGGYCDIFTKGMRDKWNNLIYLDLFAGSGFSKIRETGNIVKSSALISLAIPEKFDSYIFCEQDPKNYDCLSERIKKENKNVTHVFNDDCNKEIAKIKNVIPAYSKNNTVLTFCFLDPYHLNLHFETVQTLATDLVDFLILQALHMDANRNLKNYIEENNEKIGLYLGNKNWRDEWKKLRLLPKDFVKFLADKYDSKMKELGYLTAFRHAIKLPDKNVPLYYLTFYSKHERGVDFFKKVDEYSTNQMKLGI